MGGAAKSASLGSIRHAGHLEQHFGFHDEGARVRQAESGTECVQRDHHSPLNVRYDQIIGYVSGILDLATPINDAHPTFRK